MEGEQKFQGGAEAIEHNGKLEVERSINKAYEEIENRLGKDITEASRSEKIAVIGELMVEIDERFDNRDRFLAEVYAELYYKLLQRRMAEFEEDFKKENAKFDAILQ